MKYNTIYDCGMKTIMDIYVMFDEETGQKIVDFGDIMSQEAEYKFNSIWGDNNTYGEIDLMTFNIKVLFTFVNIEQIFTNYKITIWYDDIQMYIIDRNVVTENLYNDEECMEMCIVEIESDKESQRKKIIKNKIKKLKKQNNKRKYISLIMYQYGFDRGCADKISAYW